MGIRAFDAGLGALLLLATALGLQAAGNPWIATGPFGGNAEVIVANPLDPNILFAGTKNANLFVSRNAGDTWEPLSFPRQYASMLHTLVVDPENPAVVYAAIADEPRPGLYRSSNYGHSWKAVAALGSDEVYSLAIWDRNSKTMVAGLRQSVKVSRDGGETWKTITTPDNTDMQPAVSVAFDPQDSNTIYAGTPRLPWKTTDGGETWNLIAEGMSTDSDIITVRVDSTKPSRVFIGACSGFWHSNNSGETWSKMSGIPFTSRRTYAFVQNPDHPEIVFAGTSRGLYRTADGGSNWRNIAAHEIKSLAISDGILYVATADAGLFKSTDNGATLKPIDTGFTSRNFSHIAEYGEHLYTGTGFEVDAGAIFDSSDGGLHWNRITDAAQLGNENILAIARSKNGVLLAATPTSILRSTDLGKTWVRVKASPLHVTALRALSSSVLAGTESGLYRSSDEGQTWQPVLPSAGAVKEPVHSVIASASVTAGAVFAVLNHALLVSEDEGKTWAHRHLPFFTEVYDVAAAGEIMIAGTSRGIFRSDDAGETWHAAKSGVPTASITSVTIDPVSKNLAFAFEYGNLYESRDAGITWHRDTEAGLNGAFVRNFSINSQSPHNLIAVTATRGIFVRSIDVRSTDVRSIDVRSIDETQATQSNFPTVDTRKDLYVPNQQNDKTPAL